MNRKLSMYLAGAIRDGREEDLIWREQVIQAFPGITILNPVANKRYIKTETQQTWIVGGDADFEPSAKFLVRHDFFMVDRADIVLANLSSLAEGYPSIGTMMELGRASGNGGLIYSIVPPSTPGLANKIYKVHPFIEDISSQTFASVGDAIDFLAWHHFALDGSNPHYGGWNELPAAVV